MAEHDSRWRDVTDDEAARRDDLLAQLRAAGVRYLAAGDELYSTKERWPTQDLVQSLARSSDPRLRLALVALLLRNPAYAEPAKAVARSLVDAILSRNIQISVVAAAALQRTWAFSLDVYMPGWQAIDVRDLTGELAVPAPEADYGRATLRALDALLADGDPVPPDYWHAWEDVGRHVMDDLRAEVATHVA